MVCKLLKVNAISLCLRDYAHPCVICFEVCSRELDFVTCKVCNFDRVTLSEMVCGYVRELNASKHLFIRTPLRMLDSVRYTEEKYFLRS